MTSGGLKDFRRLLSPAALKKELTLIAVRFPLATAYVCLLTVWLCLLALDAVDPDSITVQSLTWSLVLGQLLSLAINVWTEYLGYTRLNKPLQLASLLIVAAEFSYISLSGSWGNTSAQIGRAALVTALAVAIVFIPAARGISLRGTISYTFAQVAALATAACLSMVLSTAVLIITGTFDILFGWSSWRVTGCFMAVFAYAVPALLYLGMIPAPAETARLSHREFPGFIPGACKYVLLPLAAIYTAILYAYGAKILFTLTLPNGMIVWMVTGLTVAIIVTLYGLQPYVLDNDGSNSHRIALLARRILPPALLPLLLLMSVGLGYRLWQYGPTASRLYVATFNIWAYAAVIYIMARGLKASLNSVAISFAASFVILSIVPGFNVSSMANTAIRASVLRSLEGHSLPMTKQELRRALEAMPGNEGTITASRIAYLDDWDDHSLVSDIVSTDSRIYSWEIEPTRTDSVENAVRFADLSINAGISIPEGFRTVEYVRTFSVKTGKTDTSGRVIASIDSLRVALPIDSLLNVSSESYSRPAICAVENDSDAVFMLSTLDARADTGNNNTRITSISGYIFRK